MRVAVIGAGIIGVTTAYELGAEGHEVTVLERCGTVAAETSFANAGLVAPGYVTPWAAPGMPGKVLRGLFSPHTPVRLHANLDLGWAWKWWRATRVRTYQANRLRMQRLAWFSRERLHELTRDLRIQYERRDGYLVLLRTKKDTALAQPGLATLAALGTRFELVGADRCRTIEPGLSTTTPLAAGIHLPDDEVGNCRQFALLLRRHAEQVGVTFRFDTTVERIEAGPRPRVVTVRSPREASGRGAAQSSLSTIPSISSASSTFSASAGPTAGRSETPAGGWRDTEPLDDATPTTEAFDAIVVCAALGAPKLLRPLGLRLPLAAVHGYSVTAPLRHNDHQLDGGPRSALMDERYKVAISRLGTRIRVAGSAEFGGRPERHDADALKTLYKVLDDWFPATVQLAHAQAWKGARPMLPDGPPVLGGSGIDGVWLNLGHGSSGWALACGSARLLACAIAGRAPPIDIEGLGIERLWR
jgi:D-amino-acid dehydrogenase